MSVRAKFKVTSIQDSKNEAGEITQRQVTLSAVYSSDPASANYSWSKYTPCGSASLSITNPAAFNQFEVGKEYYLDFNPAEAA